MTEKTFQRIYFLFILYFFFYVDGCVDCKFNSYPHFQKKKKKKTGTYWGVYMMILSTTKSKQIAAKFTHGQPNGARSWSLSFSLSFSLFNS